MVSLKSGTLETIQTHCFAQRPPSSHPPTHPVQTVQQRREQWQPAKASSPSLNPMEAHNVSVLHAVQITRSFYLHTMMHTICSAQFETTPICPTNSNGCCVVTNFAMFLPLHFAMLFLLHFVLCSVLFFALRFALYNIFYCFYCDGLHGQ